MKTKSLVLFAFAACVFASCSNINDDVIGDGLNQPQKNVIQKLDESVAQKEFAIILSKTVYDNPELCKFLKNEAIKTFDNNYDVFYPYVKDKIIDGKNTFRQMLLSNTTEEHLASIEESLPLLTMLVPDLSFAQAFNVNNWDTNDANVAVSFVKGNINNVIFEDGDSIMTMGEGELPAFPIIVVRSNERMKVTGVKTRANGNSEFAYEFVDKAFDGSINPLKRNTRGGGRTSYISNDTIPDEPYLQEKEIDTLVINAYKNYRSNPNNLDRDYIYYGFNNQKTENGVLRKDMQERLYKIKIRPEAYDLITDKQSKLNDDPTLVDEVYEQHELTKNYVINHAWTKGSFIFHVNFYLGKKSADAYFDSKVIILNPEEMFHIDKIRLRYKHATAFRHQHYHYYIEPEYLSAKWVDVRNLDINLLGANPWDLSTFSTSIFVEVEEYDFGTEVTTTHSITEKFDIDGNYNIEFGNTVKQKVGISSGYGHTNTRGHSIKTSDASDFMGSCYVNYGDPVILGKDSRGYRIYTYSTGSVELMILPRNKYKYN